MPAPVFDLNRYDADTLREFATLHRLAPGRQLKKADMVTALSQHFKQPEFISRAVTSLNALERQVLGLLQAGPEEGLTLPALLRLAQVVDIAPIPGKTDVGSRRPAIQNLDKASTSILQTPLRLCALGLAVPWRGPGGFPSGNQNVVTWDRIDAIGLPEHVRRTLSPVIPTLKTIPEDEIKHTASGSARSFQRDLFFYWSQVRRQPIQTKQDGLLYKRDLKIVNSVLMRPIENLGAESDHMELVFLRFMALSLELLSEASDGVITAAEAPPFLAETPDNRIRQCFESWFEALWWVEMGGYFAEEFEAGMVAPLRQALIDALRQASTEQWIDRRSLASAVAPMLLGSIYGAMNFYTYYGRDVLSDAIAAASRMNLHGNPLADYLKTSLDGPLHWMGLVDIGFDAKQQPIAVRLTPAGALVLGLLSKLDLPATTGQVIVQPNYHILAIDPVPDATLAALDSFAVRQKTGRVTEYELTKASVHQGALGGWPVSRVIAFLQQSAGTALPGNVARTLEEWQEGHNRIRFLSPAAVLETATPAETTALHRHPAAAAALGRILTPTLSLVRDLPALQQAMGDANLMLERSSAEAPAGRPCFRLLDDGRLQAVAPVLSLGASAGVAAFTEMTDAGLHITPRALMAATKSGLKVEDITESLRKALVHPLSPEWERRLKTWTAHFGNARTTPRALLELRGAEVLAELRSDPEIARLLKPFHPKHALATFDPKDRDRLLALLAQYGIELIDDLA